MDAGGWSELKADRARIGSELLFEGLSSLGLDAANVSGRDLTLGADGIESLRQVFSGRFVSANVLVDGQPLFDTHLIVERSIDGKPTRIGIVGVTQKSRAASEAWLDGELSFDDPTQSARRMAEQLRDQTDLRVLLANLSIAELENFVAEFPDAYQVIVSGNGELRASTPLGAPPFVLAPGTSGKQLAWINLARVPAGFEVMAGNSLTLDDKIGDHAETASQVADLLHRMRQHLQMRSGAPAGQHSQATAGTVSEPSATPGN